MKDRYVFHNGGQKYSAQLQDKDPKSALYLLEIKGEAVYLTKVKKDLTFTKSLQEDDNVLARTMGIMKNSIGALKRKGSADSLDLMLKDDSDSQLAGSFEEDIAEKDNAVKRKEAGDEEKKDDREDDIVRDCKLNSLG